MTSQNDNPQPRKSAEVILGLTGVPEYSSQQVHTLLRVLDQLENVLLPSDELKEEVDENVKTSASGTYIRCCNVLDNLLDERTRWDLSAHNLMEAHMAEYLKSQALFFQTSVKAEQERMALNQSLRRPSTRLHPICFQKNARWVVAYGDFKNPENCLTGEGETLCKAMTDFDNNYYNQEAAETAEEKPKKKSPKKK